MAAEARGRFDEVRREIGADTPVLYLTFRDLDYLLGDPTDCRYASPVFLQRSTTLPYVRDLPSYADNVSCVDTRARYLVVDRLRPGNCPR